MQSITERFWNNVQRGGDDECWEWRGYRMPTGYGQLQRGRRGEGAVLAHRLAFELEHGRPPVGVVRHSCDNPPCCNARHLKEGTHADNAADKVERGRHVYGERSPAAKLTLERVRQIRVLLQAGEPDSAIARSFTVARETIRDIRRGVTWKQG